MGRAKNPFQGCREKTSFLLSLFICFRRGAFYQQKFKKENKKSISSILWGTVGIRIKFFWSLENLFSVQVAPPAEPEKWVGPKSFSGMSGENLIPFISVYML